MNTLSLTGSCTSFCFVFYTYDIFIMLLLGPCWKQVEWLLQAILDSWLLQCHCIVSYILNLNKFIHSFIPDILICQRNDEWQTRDSRDSRESCQQKKWVKALHWRGPCPQNWMKNASSNFRGLQNAKISKICQNLLKLNSWKTQVQISEICEM